MIVLVFEPKFILDHPEEYDYLKPFFKRGLAFSNRIDKSSDSFEELCTNIKRIYVEYQEKQDGWQLVIKAILMLFLAVLYRYYQNNQELLQERKDFQKSYARISQVIKYINSHYREGITLEELAGQAHMNKTYLSTYFKEVMNIGIFDYIEQIRINQSCILLKTSQMPITEISLEVGFNSVSYFNRIFKRIVGVTPRVYRNNPNIVQKQ